MAEVTPVILCPYCGHTQTRPTKCESCGGFFDHLSLRATQVSMGPWFIRDKNRPYRPGCSYEILKKQITAGKVKPNSVLRGPTTRQFWSVARNTPGVAHLLGVCHQCGVHVKPTDPKCPQCSAPFRDVALRNEMGLFYPTEAAAQAAQKAIEKEVAAGNAPTTTPKPVAAPAGALNAASTVPVLAISPSPSAAPSPSPATPAADASKAAGNGEDLLDEVLGRVAKQTQGMKLKPDDQPAKSSDPKAVKRRAPVIPPPDPIAASGLTFDPVEEEDDDEPAPSRGPGMPTFLLVGLIVLVLAIQLVFAVIWLKSKNEPATGTTTPPASSGSGETHVGTDSDNTPGTVAPVPDDGPKAGKPGADSDDLLRRTYGTSAQPTPPVITNKAQDELNPLSPNFKPPVVVRDPASTDAPAVKPSEPPTDTPAPTEPAPAKTPKPKADTSMSLGTIEARMARSRFLEGQKKYAESLAILKEISKTVPLAKQPTDLDESIRRVEGLIATQKTGNFFKE